MKIVGQCTVTWFSAWFMYVCNLSPNSHVTLGDLQGDVWNYSILVLISSHVSVHNLVDVYSCVCLCFWVPSTINYWLVPAHWKYRMSKNWMRIIVAQFILSHVYLGKKIITSLLYQNTKKNWKISWRRILISCSLLVD